MCSEINIAARIFMGQKSYNFGDNIPKFPVESILDFITYAQNQYIHSLLKLRMLRFFLFLTLFDFVN